MRLQMRTLGKMCARLLTLPHKRVAWRETRKKKQLSGLVDGGVAPLSTSLATLTLD
jgi:hypothetical protein